MTDDNYNLETGVDYPDAGDQTDTERMVPLSALKSMREQYQQKLQTLEDQMAIYRNTLLSLQQQMQAMQGGGPAPNVKPQVDDPLPGVEMDEPLTKAELLRAYEQMFGRIMNVFRSGYDELRFAAEHPDYKEVLGVHLQNVLKNRPDLLAALQANPHPALAYEIGKTDPEYQKKLLQRNVSDKVERIKENKARVGSSAQAGGGGGIDPADKIRQMSRDEFRKYMEEIKRKAR